MKSNKILNYTNRLNPLAHALAGGGGNSLLDLCDLDKTSAYKNPYYFYESHAVIVGFDNVESKKSAQSANTRSHSVILSLCKRRSIHFSDLNLKAILGLYTNPRAIRRRFTQFTQIATMSSLRELQSNSWQSTFHTTHKGIKMNT